MGGAGCIDVVDRDLPHVLIRGVIVGGEVMDICDQLVRLDPTPTYDDDDAVYKVTPQVETVGCAFGSIVTLPDVRHQNEIAGEWCVECGYHHPLGQHEIPMYEAVDVCKRISAGLPSEDAKARIWQKIIRGVK